MKRMISLLSVNAVVTMLLSACNSMPVPMPVARTPMPVPSYYPSPPSTRGQLYQASMRPNVPPAYIPEVGLPQAISTPTPIPTSSSILSSTTKPAPTSSQGIKDLSWEANKIYQNNLQGNAENMVVWDEKNNQLILGIGGLTWYPQNKTSAQADTFPDFLKYMQYKQQALPTWLVKRPQRGAPWQTKTQFDTAQNDSQMKELRQLVQNTKNLQMNFMAERLHYLLPKMLVNFTSEEQKTIQRQYDVMRQSPKGLYPLLDYISFKGDGVNKNDRYNGTGWGLMQVLLGMRSVEPGAYALEEFSISAEDVLLQRIANSPAELREARWLSDWRERVNTYRPNSPLAKQ